MPVYMRLFCGDRLPVAPRGDFLYEQKVTKESFKRRGFRFPRLLKTSTLEPAKRNRARFPFDSFRGEGDVKKYRISYITGAVLTTGLAGLVFFAALLTYNTRELRVKLRGVLRAARGGET